MFQIFIFLALGEVKRGAASKTVELFWGEKVPPSRARAGGGWKKQPKNVFFWSGYIYHSVLSENALHHGNVFAPAYIQEIQQRPCATPCMGLAYLKWLSVVAVCGGCGVAVCGCVVDVCVVAVCG